MSFNLREWCLRVRDTFKSRDAEVEEELLFHLDMAEQDALRRGDSPREGRLRAGGSPRRRNPFATKALSGG
jgi:hypothetical protein